MFMEEVLDAYLAKNKDEALQLEVPIHHDAPIEERKYRLSDCGKCRLYQYMKRKGTQQQENPARIIRMMSQGNIIHAYLQKVFSEMKVLHSSEESLGNTDFSGHYDVILFTNPRKTEKALYDIKTVGNRQAYHIQKPDSTYPLEQHCMQVTAYSLFLDDQHIECKIAYVERENLGIDEFTVNKAEFEDKVMSEFEILSHHWKVSSPPKSNPKKWECRYCSYGHICHDRPY